MMTSDELRNGKNEFAGRDVSLPLRIDNLIIYYLIKMREYFCLDGTLGRCNLM